MSCFIQSTSHAPPQCARVLSTMETVTEALIELKLNKEAQPPPTANAAADDATLQQDTAAAEDTYERNKKKVTTYFLENDAGFRRLCEVRDKV